MILLDWWELHTTPKKSNEGFVSPDGNLILFPVQSTGVYRLRATSECHDWKQGAVSIPVPSQHFFCPHCGNVWVKSIVRDIPSLHRVVHRVCYTCGPGAIAYPTDRKQEIDIVPQEILAESVLRLHHWFKTHNHIPY